MKPTIVVVYDCIYAFCLEDKLGQTIDYLTNHRYKVDVFSKKENTVTYETITEETLVNLVNWCYEMRGEIEFCLVDVLSSPATMQIINNWHSAYN